MNKSRDMILSHVREDADFAVEMVRSYMEDMDLVYQSIIDARSGAIRSESAIEKLYKELITNEN